MPNQQSDELVLGIIGGSGVYDFDSVEQLKEHRVSTPYGDPSGIIDEVKLGERRIFFLARHGKGHHLTPSHIPYRANIAALKKCGVTHILAVSAVGVLRDGIAPGDLIVPDQLIDLTKGLRKSSYFENGLVGHQNFADPFCKEFSGQLSRVIQSLGFQMTTGGTYVCIEGPRFSTRAESLYFKNVLNGTCIGMTAHPEAVLAREAEMSYAILALATDYDCWHQSKDAVSVERVLEVIKKNRVLSLKTIHELSRTLPKTYNSSLKGSFENSLITSSTHMSSSARKNIDFLFKNSPV